MGTPAEVSGDREATHEESIDEIPYAKAVGMLIWLSFCTRPDISQAVSVVS